MKKVYSITVLERYIVSDLAIDAYTDLVTADFNIVQKRVEELKEKFFEEYSESENSWDESLLNKDYLSFFQLLNEDGDGVEIRIEEHEL